MIVSPLKKTSLAEVYLGSGLYNDVRKVVEVGVTDLYYTKVYQ